MNCYKPTTNAIDDCVRDNGGARYETTSQTTPFYIEYVPQPIISQFDDASMRQDFPVYDATEELFS